MSGLEVVQQRHLLFFRYSAGTAWREKNGDVLGTISPVPHYQLVILLLAPPLWA